MFDLLSFELKYLVALMSFDHVLLSWLIAPLCFFSVMLPACGYGHDTNSDNVIAVMSSLSSAHLTVMSSEQAAAVLSSFACLHLLVPTLVLFWQDPFMLLPWAPTTWLSWAPTTWLSWASTTWLSWAPTTCCHELRLRGFVMSFDHLFTVRISDWEVNVTSFDHLFDAVDSDHVCAVISPFMWLFPWTPSQKKFSRASTMYQYTNGLTKVAVYKLASSTFLLIRLGHEAETAGTVEQL